MSEQQNLAATNERDVVPERNTWDKKTGETGYPACECKWRYQKGKTREHWKVMYRKCERARLQDVWTQMSMYGYGYI